MNIAAQVLTHTLKPPFLLGLSGTAEAGPLKAICDATILYLVGDQLEESLLRADNR